jgi:hypothetical protein
MRCRFAGSCQCGAVTYSVMGRSLFTLVCHCDLCKRQSASAFGMATWLADAEIERLTGETDDWVRSTPQGRQISGRFCRRCGSRIFHRHLQNPSILSIKTGNIVPPNAKTPDVHIWTSKAFPWVSIPRDVLQFAENPPDVDTLLARVSQNG